MPRLTVSLLLSAGLLITVSAAALAFAATTHVDQQGLKFSAKAIAVERGDHVAFQNHDDVQHNIKVIDAEGDELDQGLQRPGESIDIIFSNTGRFTVRCAIHPRMKMIVDVQ